MRRLLPWGVSEKLCSEFSTEQCERLYKGTQKRCDRVVQLSDGSCVWLEMKHAWRRWYYDGINDNKRSLYNGYFHGDKHHSHSVAGDFEKLEQLRPPEAAYAALLIAGFDADDGVMTDDMNGLAKNERLNERGWRVRSTAWPTKQSAACWHRCWFWWRLTSE
jgi:hypothetical protein